MDDAAFVPQWFISELSAIIIMFQYSLYYYSDFRINVLLKNEL